MLNKGYVALSQQLFHHCFHFNALYAYSCRAWVLLWAAARIIRKATVNEGERNSSIARLSGLFVRKYIPFATVLEVMLAFNERRCRPPLEASEVSRIVHSMN
jgi:hypothetical protein